MYSARYICPLYFFFFAKSVFYRQIFREITSNFMKIPPLVGTLIYAATQTDPHDEGNRAFSGLRKSAYKVLTTCCNLYTACKSAQIVVESNPVITTPVYTESLLYRQTSCGTN